jgi:hypothetical protein
VARGGQPQSAGGQLCHLASHSPLLQKERSLEELGDSNARDKLAGVYLPSIYANSQILGEFFLEELEVCVANDGCPRVLLYMPVPSLSGYGTVNYAVMPLMRRASAMFDRTLPGFSQRSLVEDSTGASAWRLSAGFLI